MATVTGLTAERMIVMEQATIIDGEVRGNDLILITRGGSEVNAGNVRGPQGSAGPPVADGDKTDITVSSGGTVWTLDPNAVTNTKLSDMAANTIKGAVSAGDPADLTPVQVATMLPVPAVGTKGVVPALPATNVASSFGYFAADGQWKSAPPIFATKGSLDTLWTNPPRGSLAVCIDTDTMWQRFNAGWVDVTGQWLYGGQYVTAVSGSANAAWRKIGSAVEWHGGWTGAVGRAGLYWVGTALYRDVGSSWHPGICVFTSTNEIGFTCDPDRGLGGQVSANAPFVWGAGDQGTWSITYEIAW